MITDEERKRYHRQILMLGEAGQERLKAARVLIAGAGGLGTVISTYLAAAGVGTLRIVDCDVVEESNFNRQILHWSGDLGRPKTASVAEKLAALNPLILVEEISGRIDETNIDAMAEDLRPHRRRDGQFSDTLPPQPDRTQEEAFPSSTAPCGGSTARRQR